VVVVHGVGEAEAGWIDQYVMSELSSHSDLDLMDYSEVYRLPDRNALTSTDTFPVYVRRDKQRPLLFAELYWADLSKVGRGFFARTLAVLKVFFEAPPVMAQAMLRQSSRGIHRLLRALIMIAIWIFKWPIVGTNLAAFACGFALLAAENFFGLKTIEKLAGLPGWGVELVVGPTLLLLIVLGIAIGRRRVHKDIWLTDLSFSTAAAAIVVGGAIAANRWFDYLKLTSLTDYFHISIKIILWVWRVWGVFVLVAIAVLLLIALKRLVFGASKNAIPLRRPAAALWLAIIQSIGWNLVVPAAGIILSTFLVPCLTDPCVLQADHAALLGPIWAGLLGMIMIFLLMALVLSNRASAARRYSRDLHKASERMPRLIIHPAFYVLGFAIMALDIVIASTGSYGRLFEQGMLTATSAVVLFLFIWLYFLDRLGRSADGVLHIARDLIDHQYRPRFGPLSWLLPRDKKYTDTWPRRARINDRLTIMIETLIARERLEKLVFLTHSQGSVIVFDYLRNPAPNETLDRIKEIHVITLGSPINHLYSHYFDEYDQARGPLTNLQGRIVSWTNLWRVDDAIGHAVDIVPGGFIRNTALPKGGHNRYWGNDVMRQVLLDLLDVPFREKMTPETVPPVPG
jgi:hypothetical protein